MPLDPPAENPSRPRDARRRLLLAAASLVALGVALNVDRLLHDDDAIDVDEIVVPEPELESSHAGEEGRMGRASEISGLYAMNPGLVASVDAVYKPDEDVWGGLSGTEIGEAYGTGGLGLVGTGRGGAGNVGLIGVPEPAGGTYALPPGPPSAIGFVSVADDRRSTFSIDVDTATYSAMRRSVRDGRLPEVESVRIEELVNYFDYEYAPPADDAPFAVTAEIGECPWNREHKLVRVGLQGKVIALGDLPPRNLVFLVDVSGSMDEVDRLPLVKHALVQLVETLRAEDRISIVVYAGAAGLVLPPTSGADKDAIRVAIDGLQAGGSTNGGEGIQQAYAQARAAAMEDGVNRVILATDGDFNVGVASHDGLVRLIERQRRTGIELSVLGFGMGHRDHTMEQLADKGNGNYAYIDGPEEAHKVLVEEAGGTLVTIAKDVKIQVALDRARVRSWRLIGYDNRRLAHRDFADDTKDAGEIGAGHNVTALYEIVPREDADETAPWMTLDLRYKPPKGSRSALVKLPVVCTARSLDDTSDDFRFAAAVASFGMLLQGSPHRGAATYASVQELALDATGEDPSCRRHELVRLVGQAAHLANADDAPTLDVPRCEPGVGQVQDEPAIELPPVEVVAEDRGRPDRGAAEPTSGADTLAWVLEVLRLLPPLLALPLFVMALRRPRRLR